MILVVYGERGERGVFETEILWLYSFIMQIHNNIY